MTTRQLIVVEQNRLYPNAIRENVALFAPDGSALLLGKTDEKDSNDISKTVSALKGRITKLEKRIKELE